MNTIQFFLRMWWFVLRGMDKGSGCFLISPLMYDSFALHLFLVYTDCGHAYVVIMVLN